MTVDKLNQTGGSEVARNRVYLHNINNCRFSGSYKTAWKNFFQLIQAVLNPVSIVGCVSINVLPLGFKEEDIPAESKIPDFVYKM